MLIVPRFRELQESERRELWATLALRHCPGLGSRSCKTLIDSFGSAYETLASKKSWPSFGVKAQIVQAALSEEWRAAAKAEWDALAFCNPRILLWHNESYPTYLREIPDAPLLLYGEGDFSLLASPCIAIVGSRNATDHGRKIAKYFARNLASCGICVVAGLAQGIDSIAHNAALGEIGRSIGVLGNGIDVCYPVSNTQLFDAMKGRGLLVTEFAPGCKPLAKNFPIRNRLMSGISLGVLVVEATEKSGSLITAKYALEQNREVYAVPGPAMNAHFTGCQKLVRDGARPVFTTEDILQDLSARLKLYGLDAATLTFPLLEESQEDVKNHICQKAAETGKDTKGSSVNAVFATLQPDCQRLVSFLQQHGICHIDRLAEALDAPITSLNVSLMELEIAGYLKRLPGAHYDLVRE